MNLKPPGRITANEYDQLVALWEAAGLHHKPNGREAFEAQCAGGTQIPLGLLTEDGTLVGSVLVTHDGRKGWINRLAVHPDYRRRGLGKALIAAAEDTLHALGLDVIAALIEPGNDDSLALFAAAGYSEWMGLHYVSKRSSGDS